METRIRPKSDYMQAAGWQQLHVLSEKWLSELSFYRDEIRFLKDVVNKYFIWLVADEKMDTLTHLSQRLIKIEEVNQYLLETTNKHMGHLVDLIENSFSHDEQAFREEHSTLEDRIAGFEQDFMVLKSDIFTITKKVIEIERLKRLLAT